MFYFVKTPSVIRQLYKPLTWKLPNDRSAIYLTFDDGPNTDITQKTLHILKHYQVKATFFCVGENIVKNTAIYNEIVSEGHAVGNHSYNHLNGWLTKKHDYITNFEKAQQIISSKIFRPPYGKIKKSQIKTLRNKTKIIMWDVLSGDFDPKTTPQQIIDNVVNNTECGSIIVMHDNQKCGTKMLEALPHIIRKLQDKGFIFEAIC